MGASSSVSSHFWRPLLRSKNPPSSRVMQPNARRETSYLQRSSARKKPNFVDQPRNSLRTRPPFRHFGSSESGSDREECSVVDLTAQLQRSASPLAVPRMPDVQRLSINFGDLTPRSIAVGIDDRCVSCACWVCLITLPSRHAPRAM